MEEGRKGIRPPTRCSAYKASHLTLIRKVHWNAQPSVKYTQQNNRKFALLDATKCSRKKLIRIKRKIIIYLLIYKGFFILVLILLKDICNLLFEKMSS
jgi:hypothetical protein